MPESEVQMAEMKKDLEYLKEKVDAIAMNQKDFSLAVSEFKSFKAQVRTWGAVAMVAITFLKDAVVNFITGNK